jgi:hypothetical protein
VKHLDAANRTVLVKTLAGALVEDYRRREAAGEYADEQTPPEMTDTQNATSPRTGPGASGSLAIRSGGANGPTESN